MARIGTPPTPHKNNGRRSQQRHSHRERDDTYFDVIVKLAPRWRVIICKDGMQWILQKRSAEPLHQGVWRSVSYVVSRDRLIELSASLGLLSESSKRSVLAALPSSATDLRK